MTQPVIYVATFKIKEGKFQEYERFYAENLKVVEENNPRLIALHTFANEDGTEITNINVHPDTAAMDYHMRALFRIRPSLPGTAIPRTSARPRLRSGSGPDSTGSPSSLDTTLQRTGVQRSVDQRRIERAAKSSALSKAPAPSALWHRNRPPQARCPPE